MKRRYLLAAGIGAACIFAVLAVLGTLPESGVTKATFERIEPGMTIEEARAVVGTPPTYEIRVAKINKGGSTAVVRWSNPDGSGFEVHVDDVSGVYEKSWQDSTETIGERLQRLVWWPWW